MVRAAGAAPSLGPSDPPRGAGARRGRARASGRLWRAGLSLVLLLAVAFVVLAPPERCPPVSAEELRRSAQATVDWFVRNQEGDGSWVYIYNADDNTTPTEYNEVRHAGVTMGLYQAAAAGLPGRSVRRPRHRMGARPARAPRRLRRAGRRGPVTTGASALLAAGLDIRREATGDPRYDDVLARLGRFLQAQTEQSGAVLAEYDRARGAPLAGEYSKYYTGEAYWALARLHRAFPAEGWGETADRIGAYLASSRDEVEDHFPPIPDHWAAYGASETVAFPERGRPPLTTDELDYARRQVELFGAQARWLAQQHGPWGQLVRGSDTRPRRLVRRGRTRRSRAGGWPRARSPGSPTCERRSPSGDLRRRPGRRGAVRRGGRRGHRPARSGWRAPGSGTARPAWTISSTRSPGLLRTIAILEADADSAAGEPSGEDTASSWLWAAALLLALNPARAAFGVPRAGRSPRETPASLLSAH